MRTFGELAIGEVRTDGGTQQRARLEEAWVAELVDVLGGDPPGILDPVEVLQEGPRRYWLWDGFHRLAAYRAAGLKLVPAAIAPGSRRDAVLLSCGANTRGQLLRTNADKRRAVMTLLADPEWGQWSDREIARRAGVSHPFVAQLRREGGNGYHPGAAGDEALKGEIFDSLPPERQLAILKQAEEQAAAKRAAEVAGEAAAAALRPRALRLPAEAYARLELRAQAAGVTAPDWAARAIEHALTCPHCTS